MYTLNKNVPMPKPDRPPPVTVRKYPFEEMGVGDMFFVPNKTKNTLAIYASYQSRKLERRFSTRLTYMVLLDDGWVPCDPGDIGAVQGIGVWRLE
tara:strand:+ start:3721 stop:4005 length:285 start_codon:yes stop_codon:yes gene_type:complete